MSWRQKQRDPADTKIAWVIPSLNRGQYWQPIFREFAKKYPRNRVFTGIFEGYMKGFEGVFEVQRYKGGKVIKLGPKTLIWSSPEAFILLAKYRPDVIFTGGFNLGTVYALVVKMLFGSKLILLWDGVNASCSDEVSRLNSPITLWVRRLMAKFFDFTVSNSKGGAAYLRDLIGIPDSKLLSWPYLVPDGSVLRNASPLTQPLPAARPRFLFVGEMVEVKGVHLLLEALRIIRERGITEFSCVLVGAGPLFETFREQATSFGLDDVVQWTNRVPYQQIGTYFQEADIFVCPSVDDIWGMVVLEAMLAGKPILCSRYAGSHELLQHRESGLIFDPLDPSDLANCMEEMLRHPKLAAEYGRNAREVVEPLTPQRSAQAIAYAIESAGQGKTRDFRGSDGARTREAAEPVSPMIQPRTESES